MYIENQLIDLLKLDHTLEFCIYFNDDKRSIFIGNYATEAHNSEYWRETGEKFRTWWDNGKISAAWKEPFITTAEMQTISMKLDKSESKVYVYKNGKLMGTQTDSQYGSSYNYDWTKVWIGRDNVEIAQRGMKGRIYSVRIYNRLLSDDEINHNYLVDRNQFNF